MQARIISLLLFFSIPFASGSYRSYVDSESFFYQPENQALIEKIVHNELRPYLKKTDSKSDTKQFSSREIQIIQKLKRMPSKKGIFISLFNKDTKHLAGCMGSTIPVQKSLYAEIIHWSNMAYLFDKRADSKTKENLSSLNLAVVISIIQSVDSIDSFKNVQPLSEGLMIRYQSREALVLAGEARTSVYARKMVLKKLNIKPETNNSRLKFFVVRSYRFGSGKYLM